MQDNRFNNEFRRFCEAYDLENAYTKAAKAKELKSRAAKASKSMGPYNQASIMPGQVITVDGAAPTNRFKVVNSTEAKPGWMLVTDMSGEFWDAQIRGSSLYVMEDALEDDVDNAGWYGMDDRVSPFGADDHDGEDEYHEVKRLLLRIKSIR